MVSRRRWLDPDHKGTLPVKRLPRQWRKFIFHKVLHADDTPHDIAIGVATATFVAFLPLVGLQTVIAVAIAVAIRANKAVCIPIVWITNPVTIGPIYGACMMLGGLVTGEGRSESQHVAIQTLLQHQGFGRFLELGFWRDLLHLLLSFGGDLWIGCALVGMVFAVAGYFVSRWGVGAYREGRRRRKLQRELFRVQRRSIKIAQPRGSA